MLSAICATYAFPAFEGEQRVDVTQDTLGNYNYLIKTADFSKMEVRHPDGSVTGEYSFPDATGAIKLFKYRSGKDGFQIVDGPVPVAPIDKGVPVPEGAELIAARNQHLALLRGGSLPVAPALAPIDDTPEVKAAKEAFFAAFNAAKH